MKSLPLFILVSTTLFGNIEFSSNEIKAHDNEILLKGDVLIKHPLGILTANEATLVQGGSHHQTPSFLSACLKSCVELQFGSEQTLLCEAATIDFVHNTASLTSPEKLISFFDPKRHTTIQSQNVDCEWNDGHLKLNTHSTDHPCTILIGQDEVKADSATVEVENETLILYKPIGKIAANLISLTHPEEISFSSNILNWDRKSGEISLKENILVDGNSFGSMRSTDKISFATEKVDEKLLFKGFKATGKSHLITPGGMKIICDGDIEFDHDKRHLSAMSIVEPIVYENGDLRIEAHQLTFDQLEGNPKIISFYDHVTFSSGAMHGTAGGLTYRPEEHTLEFFSLDQENVVFHNRETDIKMSADSLSISRDPETKENIIQGHGIVKLTFDHKQRDELIEVISSCMKNSF